MKYWNLVFAVCGISAIVEATTDRPGKSVILKNCHCTCYDEDAPHPDICDATTKNISNAYVDSEITFVTRAEWGARPPTKMLLDLETVPAPYVVISHTATKSCYSKSQCLPHIRSIQAFHIESHGWLDIGYNFLIGGDGFVYIGRGWDKQGAYTHKYHQNSIEISFIGTFREERPTQVQLDTARKLMQIGVRENKLARDYKLLEHKQVGLPHTQRPGDLLYDIIKTWEHWDPNH
ncbi:peptidoglycan recognition protein 1-like [Phymastichus coffea]|uniref:peptidoglycan recognition protein 1-like n=1 Tax=Phymastichus coffea TaxID=108790 RepID=UPI00273B308F|nr:peptidoglycan recognition protein 1-like [Phymastichus coffea]